MSNLNTTYIYKEYEEKWWQYWNDNNFFKANPESAKPEYSIIMPPPNVTDRLHLGHGLNNTLQDILIRWKRMLGFETCWLPGTDHAGIATQMMVERLLAKEGLTKEQLGREAFLKRCQEWKENYGGIIVDQLKRMGMSADWSRQAYTMDESLSQAVRKVFVDLYNDGLIYRGERLVNWDCMLKTAISDDEVENKEISGSLWYFRYRVEGTSEAIPFATTRPETMLGDTGLAVHPSDERYQHLVGKMARHPFSDRLIPIVADDYVKSDFGTGCVKITPAHDANDFDLGKRHGLVMLNILNQDGTLNENTPAPYRGLDRFEARKEIIKAMKNLNLFDKDETYKTTIPHSERSKTVIEPRLSLQWYVKMEPLVKDAIKVAKDGSLNFYPDSWKKTYFHWLENIQDWCISRQLWWGHRIPIWYCKDCLKITCSTQDPEFCEHCSSKELKQDEDVLDTWFSSWLWPLSPFGWPEETADLQRFYPSNVLITAFEIIFLWVARMVVIGLRTRGEVPFKDIFFNPVVCDVQGRKMSKTLGNGIDPLEVIEKYGADTTRFTVANLASVGGRVKLALDDFESGSRFINKLWNASRFLFQFIEPNLQLKKLEELPLDMPSQWLINQLQHTAIDINRHLENYRTFEAVSALYHFIWGDVCDWGLECAKEALNGTDPVKKDATLSTLIYVFDGMLRLASPVIPFVAEELWQKLPRHPNWDMAQSLVLANFPTLENTFFGGEQANEWQDVQKLISEVRSVKSQAQLPRVTDVTLSLKTPAKKVSLYRDAQTLICRLAGVKNLNFLTSDKPQTKSLVAIGSNFEAFLPVDDSFNTEAEVQRLQNEKVRIEKILGGLEGKLKNKDFVARAPQDVVEATKQQLANLQFQRDSILANLKALA